jgi:hypothetical protein
MYYNLHNFNNFLKEIKEKKKINIIVNKEIYFWNQNDVNLLNEFSITLNTVFPNDLINICFEYFNEYLIILVTKFIYKTLNFEISEKQIRIHMKIHDKYNIVYYHRKHGGIFAVGSGKNILVEIYDYHDKKLIKNDFFSIEIGKYKYLEYSENKIDKKKIDLIIKEIDKEKELDKILIAIREIGFTGFPYLMYFKDINSKQQFIKTVDIINYIGSNFNELINLPEI